MKFGKENLKQTIREEIERALREGLATSAYGVTVHPFANQLANQPDKSGQEDIYNELANATLMEMVSVYNEEKVREIIRFLVDRASQGPEGIGGRFSDEQVEEILLLVFEKVQEKLGVNLASHLPQDRQHPQYMDLD